jgi:hypothetical protein
MFSEADFQKPNWARGKPQAMPLKRGRWRQSLHDLYIDGSAGNFMFGEVFL